MADVAEGMKIYKDVSNVMIIINGTMVTTDSLGNFSYSGTDGDFKTLSFQCDKGMPLDNKDITLQFSDNGIDIEYSVNASNVNCNDSTLSKSGITRTPNKAQAAKDISLGGMWDSDPAHYGQTCLDDNGYNATMTVSGSFLNSDCIAAPWSTLCSVDHFYADHGCYHHQGGKNCSPALGHSQNRHLH